MIDLDLQVNNIGLFNNYNTVIVPDEVYNMSDEDIIKNMSASKLKKYTDLCSKMYSVGYLLDPRIVFDNTAYDSIVYDIYPYVRSNYNTTFYKEWTDVISRSREHLWLDQLVHYMSTYGTDYEGETLVPNDDPVDLPFVSIYDSTNNFKVIKASSLAVMYNKFINILSTPVALSENNLQCMLVCIKSYWDILLKDNVFSKEDINTEVKNIKNKEAKCILAHEFNVEFSDPLDMMRYIWYIGTNNTQIVQSSEEFKLLNYNLNYDINPYRDIADYINNLSDDDMIKLARVYYRYKKVFICVKKRAFFIKDRKTINTINRLSRYAKKYHVACVPGFWESVTDKHIADHIIGNISRPEDYKYKLIDRMQKDAESGRFSAFKAIKIYNKVNSELLSPANTDTYSLYYIRNNKVYIKENEQKEKLTGEQVIFYNQLKLACLYYVVNKVHDYLKENNIKYIVMPDNAKIKYACPTSEKNFIGSVPVWSNIDLSASMHNILGVYWRNEWGTHDFDLSAIDVSNKIGWNSYYDKCSEKSQVIFSGDMTNANPEATECFYFRNIQKIPDMLLFNNRYNGAPGSKFRLFFAQGETNSFGMGYMVDPSEVLFQTDIVSVKKQQIVGAITDNKFVFINADFGDKAVSGVNNNNNRLLEHISNTIGSKLTFNDVFKYCYDICTVVTKSKLIEIQSKAEDITDDNILDLDFNSLTKNTFINILK